MKVPQEIELQIFSASSKLHEVLNVTGQDATFRIYFSFSSEVASQIGLNVCKYSIMNEIKETNFVQKESTPLMSRSILHKQRKKPPTIILKGEIDLTKFMSNDVKNRSSSTSLKIKTSDKNGKKISISSPNELILNVDRSTSFSMLDVLFRKQKDPANELNKTISHELVEKIIDGTSSLSTTNVSNVIKSSTITSEIQTSTKSLVAITNESSTIKDAYFDISIRKNEFSTKVIAISCQFQTLTFKINFEELYHLNTIPTESPAFSVSNVGTKRIINLKQVDKFGKYIEIFRKNANNIEEGYTKFSTLKLRKGESIKYVDETNQMNNFIYRAVSKNERNNTSGNFSSCYVKGKKNHKHEAPDTSTILATETQNGINLKVFNIPKETISIKIVRKNLTLNEKSFSIITTNNKSSIFSILIETKDVEFLDNSVRPNSIYEYGIITTDLYGSERLSSHKSIINFVGKNYDEDNLSLSVSLKNDKGSSESNSFTIAVPENESSLNTIYDSLISAGYDSYYVNEIKQNREKLKDLFAFEILRFDTVTGENESFGVQQSLEFSDTSARRNKSKVSNLKSNRSYIYQFRLLIRSYSSIISNSIMTRTDLETSKTHVINMKKFTSPKTLKKGTLVSNAIQKDAVFKSGYKLKQNAGAAGEFLQGKTSITTEIMVTTQKSDTSLIPLGVQKSAKGNVLKWKLKLGDQMIDHVIVYADYNGQLSPLKFVHCSDKNESYYVDDKLTAPLEEIKYFLQLVYLDYTKGPVMGPLKEM